MQAGSTRARTSPTWSLGVTKGYERKLELVGVGFRAAVQGKVPEPDARLLARGELTIAGRHHDRDAHQTEIVIKGIDKQQVGQVAAKIRDIRPPEPYKGKGVRYAGEKIVLKEGKKK
jgi:large subunit ribosomal protein L6